MSDLSTTMAKLSGIRKALSAAMSENVSRNRSAGEVKTRATFSPDHVQHYFAQAAGLLENLKGLLPDLYSDFQAIGTAPDTEMAPVSSDQPAPRHFSRSQAERLVRDIDQIFEIRANSELEQPKQKPSPCVFISHGRSNDWRAVQRFIEKMWGCLLSSSPRKRIWGARSLKSHWITLPAAIVLTGDDTANQDQARVRENAMHEIGFFQGKYGRNFVVLLHEEGVNIPTNLAGIANIPFPKGNIEAGFHVLQRELRAIYKI